MLPPDGNVDIMDMLFTILLALAAFFLAAIPFAVLIGRWGLHKDITTYGDGNPGAANVFKAGNKAAGLLAVALDVAKGIPLVYLSHTLFGLPAPGTVFIAICAVLGHAFSPFLHWRGGKAIAVTFGVMLGLPQYDILLAFIIFVLIGFFFIEIDAWKMVFGASATTVYLVITHGLSWQPLLMLVLLTIMILKHFEALHTLPRFQGLIFRLVQGIKRGTLL
jgi:acyl phosphate:glycerol-3-phosphate acyltransferase